MNKSSKTILVLALVVVVALLLLLGGWAITGTTMSVDMAENGMMDDDVAAGIGLMWIPFSLMTGLVVLLVWAIFRRKE